MRRFLYVGNLERGKRIDLLLAGVKALASRRDGFVLEIVGSGSQEAALQKQAEELGIGKQVKFFGFKQQREVVRHLARADCFLFPSEYDIWGLVLVEAMAAGVMPLGSVHSGATRDLIREGETGFALDFARTDDVVRRMVWVLENPEDAARIGRQAQAFIQKEANLGKSASGFVRAIQQVCAN